MKSDNGYLVSHTYTAYVCMCIYIYIYVCVIMFACVCVLLLFACVFVCLVGRLVVVDFGWLVGFVWVGYRVYGLRFWLLGIWGLMASRR